MNIKSILQSKNIKNSGWLIGQQIFNMIMQFVISIFTVRYLGPSNFGTLSYTASYVTFFTSVATLGMDSVVIKKIVDHPNDEGTYLGTCMLYRVLSSVFSIISILAIVYILNPDESIKLLIVSLQSIQLTFKAVQILDSWFQRYLLSKYVSIGKMIACFIVSAYKIFLLVTSKSIIWFAIADSMTDGIIAIVECWYYHKKKNCNLKIINSKGIDVLKESYNYILTGLMINLYSQMDRVMIGKMLDDYYVGLYSAAINICNMLTMVLDAVIISFRPSIIEAKNDNKRVYMRKICQLYSIMIWSSIIIVLGTMIFGRMGMFIVYGDSYIKAVPILSLAILSDCVAKIGSVWGIWILCEGKNKYSKYFILMGFITNLVLNYFLIGKMGIMGAAVATLATHLVANHIAPVLFRETRGHVKIMYEALILKWYWNNDNS